MPYFGSSSEGTQYGSTMKFIKLPSIKGIC